MRISRSLPRSIQVLLSLAVLFAFLLPACESTTEPTLPRWELLTSTLWRSQKILVLGPLQGQSTDITSNFPAFTISFGKEGTYASVLQSGTWELIENDTKILFDKGLISQTTAEIVELDRTRFRMKLTLPLNDQLTPLEMTFAPSETPITGNAPELNFETLWSEYDTRYSFFGLKKINWDSLHSVYRPQVTEMTGDPALFQIMASMLDHLKDGHVNLITPFGSYAYRGWYSNYPTNFPGLSAITRYLTTDYGTTAGGAMRYGKISTDIGYLYVGPNFTGDQNTWSQGIDRVIDSLKNMNGIIIDIRSNGGGSDALARIVASRFADQVRVFSYIKWKNQGPNHNDFTDMQPLTLEPAGVRRFLKPVALLTNRRTFSSAEEAVLMMRVMSHVTVVGDTTGGGSGNPIILQLPNSWTYWVPRWIMYTAEQTAYEGTGLPPDIPLWITPADSAAGRDAILERAIQHLR